MSYSLVVSGTPDLNKSKQFYQNLNFTTVRQSDESIIYSDGTCFIEVNADVYTRPGIKLIKPSWEEELEQLKGSVNVVDGKACKVLNLPGGLWVYLCEGNDTLQLPDQAPSKLGNNYGLSFETAESKKLKKSLEVLGFNLDQGDADSSWFSMKNSDGLSVSIMAPLTCPHVFFNPSLNFFNGKENMKRIEEIRQAGVFIAEEITHFNPDGLVDNIIVRDPGGLGFFVFSD